MTPVDPPWGHKLTVHVYVKGSIEDALDVGDKIADVEDDRIDFMGTDVREIQTKPHEQGGA